MRCRAKSSAASEAGFDSYITKPIDVPEFVRSLKELLQSAKLHGEPQRPISTPGVNEADATAEDRLRMWAERRPRVKR